MAEIQTNNRCTKKGIAKRMIKKSTRVDLTPMVDLGFLLVTFFVFTSTMTQPKAMQLNVPKASKNDSTTVCESCALTLLPGIDNQIFYYHGTVEGEKIQETNYTSEGIRKLLVVEKRKVIAVRGSDQLQVIIKPMKESSMKNFVNIMDEMNIDVVSRYFVDEPTKEDIAKVGDYNL